MTKRVNPPGPAQPASAADPHLKVVSVPSARSTLQPRRKPGLPNDPDPRNEAVPSGGLQFGGPAPNEREDQVPLKGRYAGRVLKMTRDLLHRGE